MSSREKRITARLGMLSLAEELQNISTLSKIDTIEKHTVVIRGKEIPIGEGYRADFLRRLRPAGD